MDTRLNHRYLKHIYDFSLALDFKMKFSIRKKIIVAVVINAKNIQIKKYGKCQKTQN